MSTSNDCNVDSTSKSNDDGVCEVNDMLQNMSTADNDTNISVCANCGKEGASNTCNKCKQVRYCNAVCKKVHKKKHKKDCEEHIRLAAEKHNEELRIAAEKHDEELFKQPPPLDGDCPICFLRLPTLHTGYLYKSCCSKIICCGCVHAPVYDDQGNKINNEKCPFCRTPAPTSDEEANEREKVRVETDASAMYNQGMYYQNGIKEIHGLPPDHAKALELFHRAGELGYAKAYNNLGYAYEHGEGVEVDKEKARHYYELAAMGGGVTARHNLGMYEYKAGNMERVIRHLMIAARSGYAKSLNNIKLLYMKGHVTKVDYTKALQAYQEYLSEIKSDQRDKAAAACEDYRYY